MNDRRHTNIRRSSSYKIHKNHKISRRVYISFIRCFIGLAIMLCGSGIFGLVNSYAGTSSVNSELTKVFISEEIRLGHDIYDIARENLPGGTEESNEGALKAYLAEVMKINHIYELEELDAGNHIIVPSYK